MSPPHAAKIFISYSHDSPAHRERVLRLGARLAADGLEVRLDQFVAGTPPEGWPRWMLDQLDWADYVLVVCTGTYYRRFRGHDEPGRGRGADWEGALITNELYGAKSRTRKFVPIFFEAAAERFIPEPLRGQTFHVLRSEEAYRALYGFLTNQPEFKPVERGELVPLPVREVEPLRWDAAPGSGPDLRDVAAKPGDPSAQPVPATAVGAETGRPRTGNADALPWWRRSISWAWLAAAVVLGALVTPAVRRPLGAERALGTAFDRLVATLREGSPVAAGFSAEVGATVTGPWRTLDDGSAFHAGEFLRLRIHLQQPAFLYLLNKDDEGKAEVLMPQTRGEKLSRGSPGPWRPGDWVFPEMVGELPLQFAEAPRKESFVVFASSTEVADLPEKLAAFAQAGRDKAAAGAEAETRRWRDRDLRFSTLVRTAAGYGSRTNPATHPGTTLEKAVPLFTGRDSVTALTLNLRVEK